MRLYFFFVFVIMSYNLHSQSYVQIDTTRTEKYSIFLDDFALKNKLVIEDVKKEFSADFERNLIKLYVDQYHEILNGFEKGELYFDSKNQKYLNDLLSIIIANNPELNGNEIKAYFSRESFPNAFSVGDGNLIVNLNLLKLAQNEGELVSVICHEIAHYTLKHREKSYKKYVEYLTSAEYKKEEKEINKLKYNKQKRAENFLKDIIYSKKSKSRIQETEADSLGFVYFSRTKYNPKNFINLLSNLENSDVEKDSLVEQDLRVFFTTKNQKFIQDWLVIEDFSNYKYSMKKVLKWDIDSLKTHPDCKDRIQKIEKLINSQSNNDFQYNDKYFNELKAIADYETVSNYYYFNQYGYSLYEALKLLKKHINDQYLLKMVSNNLEKLYNAKKAFKLSTYIPSINPIEQTKSQQLFYSFITNLTLNELENLSNDYKEITN